MPSTNWLPGVIESPCCVVSADRRCEAQNLRRREGRGCHPHFKSSVGLAHQLRPRKAVERPRPFERAVALGGSYHPQIIRNGRRTEQCCPERPNIDMCSGVVEWLSGVPLQWRHENARLHSATQTRPAFDSTRIRCGSRRDGRTGCISTECSGCCRKWGRCHTDI